jgi:hypothetical protein
MWETPQSFPYFHAFALSQELNRAAIKNEAALNRLAYAALISKIKK